MLYLWNKENWYDNKENIGHFSDQGKIPVKQIVTQMFVFFSLPSMMIKDLF